MPLASASLRSERLSVRTASRVGLPSAPVITCDTAMVVLLAPIQTGAAEARLFAGGHARARTELTHSNAGRRPTVSQFREGKPFLTCVYREPTPPNLYSRTSRASHGAG